MKPTTPRHLLLATDLSGRCDRALERTIELTKRWGARLTVVHALEQTPAFTGAQVRRRRFWHDPEERSVAVARQLQADIHDDGVKASVVVEEGNPGELVLQAAAKQGADLILTGTARSEPFGRLLLGATVERLVRQAAAPVLVVRNRVRGPYRNIVVATDFSAASSQALTRAAAFFGESRLTLFHAYQTPYAGMASAGTSEVAWGRMARSEVEAFVAASALPDEVKRGLGVIIEPGRADGVLRDYVQQQGVDLVVLGKRGRSAMLNLLLGSTSEALIHLLPCDVMVAQEADAVDGC